MERTQPDPIAAALASVLERPSVTRYWDAASVIREHEASLRPIRVSLLASFTVQPLVPFLEVEAAGRGLRAEVHIGDYNSARRELLDPESGCHRHRPDVVFVLELLEDVAPRIAHEFMALDDAAVDAIIEETVAELARTLGAFRASSQATVVVANFVAPRPVLGIYDATAEHSQSAAVLRLNLALADAVRPLRSVYVLDFSAICAEVGSGWRDTKMWHVGRAPLSARMMPSLASALAAFLSAVAFGPRKCLVLDLDDTLWGGILGEEGPANIKVGTTFPGSPYLELQRVVLELNRRGVLLAINSKNNEDEVLEVFRRHPDLVLRLEHFAATRINWRTKPDNMLEIAQELNIGLDSLVFLDDSPNERSLMRHALPQVLTLELPPDPAGYADALLRSHAFDPLSLTDEDRGRGRMYREEAERRHARFSRGSLDEYLRDLQTVVSIAPIDDHALPRVADLLQKTNQFNLTMRRHSQAWLSDAARDPSRGVFSLRSSDRFGDSGLVGAAVVQLEGTTARIDNFVMSCRVIGRAIETAMLSFILDWARSRGMTVAEGEFIPSAKNAPAADFYPRHGFAKAEGDGGSMRWCIELRDPSIAWPQHIRRGIP